MKCPFKWLDTKASSSETLQQRFERDPLAFLDNAVPAANGLVQTGPNDYFLGDPSIARDILLNGADRFGEAADFFNKQNGRFEPRSAQLKVRTEGRTLFKNFLLTIQGDIPHLVRANLAATTRWPDAGNQLVAHIVRPVLLCADSPEPVQRLLDDIVKVGVLRNNRLSRPRWRGRLLAFRASIVLSEEIERRRPNKELPPKDWLDVVVRGGEAHHSNPLLIDLYLGFLFSAVGGIGFVLGWSLYLMGSHRFEGIPSKWIVQEALRLWPTAWVLQRRPNQPTSIAGRVLDASNTVTVCSYLVQRQATHWENAEEFIPERWADPAAWRNPAFIAFGHGPHRCAAADLATSLATELLNVLREEFTLTVTSKSDKVFVDATLAPPLFELKVARKA
jgi:cytochrome P450